jgi:predicted nicotinamide N-methyase
MCQYLETGSLNLRGAQVVELGAGTGMAGVMAARLGAHVTLTDLPHVLPNLQKNVDLNAATCGDGSLTVAPLRWGILEDATMRPDFVIAADCVYYDSLFEPLMQTLKWLTVEDEKRKPAVVLLAHLRRWKKDSQFFRMAAKCFHVEVVHKVPIPDHARIGVVVYKFRRK